MRGEAAQLARLSYPRASPHSVSMVSGGSGSPMNSPSLTRPDLTAA